MTRAKTLLRRLVYSALCLSVALVLPFLTGAVPEVGNLLCPMHLPVLLAGYVTGPIFGGTVGLLAPILRHFFFGAPSPFMPRVVVMAVELLCYGALSGLLRRAFPKKTGFLYLSLALAMVGGRIAAGLLKTVLFFAGEVGQFGFALFFTDYFIETLPGMAVQFALIPPLVLLLEKRSSLVN